MSLNPLPYQLKRQTEEFGNHRVEIECLKDLNETIDALFSLLEKTGDTSLLEDLCPYFGVVWPSARALSDSLVYEAGRRGGSLSGLRILELGCGLAVPSLLAARLGAEITAADFHPEVPKFLEKNKALNSAPLIQYVHADWRQSAEALGTFDWVMGSDILYEFQHTKQVAKVVAQTVRQGGLAIIADPARPYLQAFSDEMGVLGFKGQTEVLEAFDTPVPKEIFVIRLQRE
ncbi:methyltransferase domain-containing protein [Bdellovibrionota bacterium FG-2]